MAKLWHRLACPVCLSTDITMTVEYPGVETGPGGRGRLGDAGSKEVNICNTCGHRHRYTAKKDT
jgi:RNase P subunit RPR2